MLKETSVITFNPIQNGYGTVEGFTNDIRWRVTNT